MPGRKGYFVAAAVLLVGGAAFALFVFTRLHGLAAELQQVVVPGQADLVLEQPGTYTIYHERRSVVDGRYYESSQPISGLRVLVVSSETGQPVSLTPPAGQTTYNIGGRAGVSVLKFAIDHPGSYRLTAAYGGGDGSPVVLAVGHDVGKRILLTVLGGLGIAFAVFAVAVTIAAVTFRRRRAAKAA